MHTVLTYKATRKPQSVATGLDRGAAIEAANALYDTTKMLSDHGLLASGVSIVVMTDTDAQAAVAAGSLPCLVVGKDSVLIHQCGGY